MDSVQPDPCLKKKRQIAQVEIFMELVQNVLANTVMQAFYGRNWNGILT